MRPARLRPNQEQIPPSVGVRTAFRLGTSYGAAFATLLLYASGVAAGADPAAWVPSPPQPASRTLEDLDLGLRARKALLQEDALAGQTLGVSVRNRVATLWGAVASASLARRAEERLRNVPGLTAIRNELYVEGRGEPQGNRFSTPRAPSRAPLNEPLLPDTRPVRGALVHRAGEQGPTPGHEFAWRPAARQPPDVAPTQLADRLVDQRPMPDKPLREALPGYPSQDPAWKPNPLAASSLNASSLRQPRVRAEDSTPVVPSFALPLPPTAAGPEPATVPSPSANPQLPPGLAQAVESLRLADDRFRRVRVEVRGDTVYLRGEVYRWEHLFELARSVARLPGARQVLFEDVRTELRP